MTTRALRAGVIGLGRIGRHHARILRTLDGADLAGVADPQGDRYRAADGYPVVADPQELIRLGLDYVILAVPTPLHEQLACTLAAAGIPTLIEKPLAADPAAAHHIAEAFRAAGVLAAVGYVERFNPALIALRARLEAGELGDVFCVSTRRTDPFPVRPADVGVIHDLATHDLDLTSWITGTRYTSIAARTAHRSGRPHEDLLAALGQLSDGTIAHHHANWISPMKERTTIVTGDRGCLVADTLTADLTYWANGTVPNQWEALTAFRGVTEGNVTRYSIPKQEPLLAEHEAFRDLVLGRSSRTATLQDGLHAVLTAHVTLRASRTGHVIPVPDLAVPVTALWAGEALASA